MASNEVLIDIKIVEKSATQSLKKLGGNVKKFEATASASFAKVSQSWDFFKGIIAANVVSKAFNAITSTIAGATTSFLDLSGAISEINSILPENQKLTEATTQQFLKFSSTFGGAASEQAKAFYQIVSAGITGTAEATKVLAAANRASVAGLTDMKTSADALTSALATYGKKGEDVESISDKLFATVREGKTTFGEIASNIGKIAPIASAAGIKFAELTGSLAFLTKTGLSTDESATGLRATISSLIKPSVEAKKEFAALDIAIDSQAIKQKGLSGIMADVIKKTGGSTEAMGKLFPNIMALNTVLAISKGDFQDFNRIIDSVGTSTGATGAAFEEVSQSAKFQLGLLGQKLENLATSFLIGMEKPIAAAITSINALVDSFGSITQAIASVHAWFVRNGDAIISYSKALGIVVASIGAFVAVKSAALTVMGLYRAGLLAITIQVHALTIAQKAFALASKLTPWGIAIAAIAALTVGIGYLIKNWETVSASLKQFGAIILSSLIVPLQGALGVISSVVGIFDEDMATAVSNQIEKLQEYRTNLEENAKKELENAEQSKVLADEKAEQLAHEIEQESLSKQKEVEGEKAKQKKLNAIKKESAKVLRKIELDDAKKRDEQRIKRLDIEAELLKSENQVQIDAKEKARLDTEFSDKKHYQFIKEHLGQTEAVNMAFEASRLDAAGKHAEAKKKIDDAYLKAYQANNKKLADDERKAQELKAKYNYTGGETIQKMNSFFNQKEIKGVADTANKLVALQNSKVGALAAIGKAAALVRITMDTAQGAMGAYSSMASIPFVGPALGIAAAAAVIAYGAEQYATVLGSFQQGGIVPGQNMTGDQVLIRANSGEMVLNKQQQAQLFNMSNGNQGTTTDNGSMGALIDAIQSQPIVVEIDGREIATAVRTAQEEGFAIEGA